MSRSFEAVDEYGDAVRFARMTGGGVSVEIGAEAEDPDAVAAVHLSAAQVEGLLAWLSSPPGSAP